MIAIDWGTSALRAYRLDDRGACTAKRDAALGIMQVKDTSFPAALESVVGDWLAAGEAQIIMSGMVGSRQGWLEVPYVECPASDREVSEGMKEVTWGERRATIVPGLACRGPSGVVDVMRGEETQILGAMSVLGDGDHLICLPGTHSKWVMLRHRRFVSFGTHMTGELFALLKQHSILGRLMAQSTGAGPAAQFDDYFDKGVTRARDPGGLSHHLFGIRAEGLFGRLPAEAASHYLSGLLIGHEIVNAQPATRMIALLGAAPLTARYSRALEDLGYRARILDEDCAMLGLHRLGTGNRSRT
jgi:2-dehydro-3-deoxygalactonokinase